MTTMEKISSIIAEQMHIDAKTATRESDIKTDIKADSLDIAQILFALEDEFGIEIPTDKALELTNLGQFADLIDSLIK